MKLRTKIIDSPFGGVLVLCTEDGEVLPNQTALTLEQTADNLSCITVRIAVDGVNVIVGDAPPRASAHHRERDGATGQRRFRKAAQP